MRNKRGVVFFNILILLFIVSILVFTNFSSAQTTEIPEKEKIDKAYNWLEYKVGNWQSLYIREHSLAVMALECRAKGTEGIGKLHDKSFYNNFFQCWGYNNLRPSSISNCDLLSTGFARLAIAETTGENMTKVDAWILNQSKFYDELEWFLQLDTDRGNEMNCTIEYNQRTDSVIVYENKTVSLTPSVGSCFNIVSGYPYWLHLANKDCYKNAYKVKCDINDTTKSFIASLLYKANLTSQGQWYVSPDIYSEISGKEIEIYANSYCLKDSSGNCNYEATLWNTLALKKSENENYKKFIPYLVIESTKTENKKYFPQAFLYLLGIQSYSQEIQDLQNIQGFWKINSTYGQFYDTALAGLTNLGNLGTEKGGARYYLTNFSDGKTFIEQGDYRYWKCGETGCYDLRDTAFLLWSFWNDVNCGGADGSCYFHDGTCNETCSAGYVEADFECNSGLVCCISDIVSGTCSSNGGFCKTSCSDGESELSVFPCSGGNVCCKNSNESYCMSDLQGQLCQSDEICNGYEIDSIDNIDNMQCCSGICLPGTIGEQTCMEIGGYECYDQQACIDEDLWQIIPFVPAKQSQRCCYSSLSLSFKCIQNKQCSEIGAPCPSGERCSVSTEETIDEKECCSGICQQSCDSLGGEICGTEETCSTGRFDSGSYDRNCCTGECKKKTSLAWLWILLIIIILLGGGFALYWFKFRKKSEGKEKPKIFGNLFQQQIQRPQPAQVRPVTPSQFGIPRPTLQQYPKVTPRVDINIKTPSTVKTNKTKTDIELEKTLSKLKKMTKEKKTKKK